MRRAAYVVLGFGTGLGIGWLAGAAVALVGLEGLSPYAWAVGFTVTLLAIDARWG